MFYFKTLFVSVVLATSLLGCLRGAKKPTSEKVSQTDTTRNFRVSEITSAASVAVENTKSDWKLPSSTDYSFKVCLINRSTQAPAAEGQEFKIVFPDKSFKREDTNEDGCLIWKERIDFNFISQSVYIEKNRQIVGTGMYNGTAQIRIGVNPWAKYRNENTPEVVDLDRHKLNSIRLIKEIEEDAERIGLFTHEESKKIHLQPNPFIKLIELKPIANGKRFKLIARFKPYLSIKGLDGISTPHPLRTGSFRVFAQLAGNYLGQNTNEHMLITSSLIKRKTVSVNTNGDLTFETEVDITRITNLGQVQLAIKLEPTLNTFSTYNGLYNISPFSDIASVSSGTQIKGPLTSSPFDYTRFLEQKSSFDSLKSKFHAQDGHPYYFSELLPRFVRIKTGETSTKRTIIYRITTTLKDSYTGRPVPNRRIQVTRLSDGVVLNIKSNQDGLVKWMNEITHMYYQPEQYRFHKFKVFEPVSKLTQELAVALNPWDEGWTFGEDLNLSKPYYDKMSKQKVRNPILMTDAFRYQTIRFRYEIDEHMTLNVKKAVVMAMDPLVQRFTIVGGRRFEPLRDGIYLAKIALIKHYIDPFSGGTKLIQSEDKTFSLKRMSEKKDYRKGKYSTIIKKLLRVQAGRITTPLEFSMRDLRMMSIRTNIMVQLETIDELKLLRDNLMVANLNELENKYNEYQSKETNHEKEQFLEKLAQLEQKNGENFKLSQFLKHGLKKFFENEVKQQYGHALEKRDKALSKIEDRLGETLSSHHYKDRYRNLFQKPQNVFSEILKEAKSGLVLMENTMKSFWKDWESDWKTSHSQKEALASSEQTLVGTEKSPYYNYLLSMEVFLNKMNLPTTIGKKEFKKFQVNNYTVNPAAPFIDLNLYIEKNSGLAKRTFIGPCTLIENDNMSEMRPTNTLDEKHCERVDCSEEIVIPGRNKIENSAFENSKYHESLKFYASKHVDDFFEMHKKNELQYEHTMKALSQKGNFVEGYNYKYLDLNNQPLKKFKNGCKFENSQVCLKEIKDYTISFDHLASLSSSYSTKDLLSKYFHMHSFDDLVRTNQEVLKENKLQPLLDRAKQEFLKIASFYVDKQDRSKKWQFSFKKVLSTFITGGSKEYQKAQESVITDISKDRIKTWIKKGSSSVKLEEALMLCQYFANQGSKNILPFTQSSENTHIREPLEPASPKEHSISQILLNACMAQIQYLPKSNQVFFPSIEFDRRLKILKAGPYEHISGKNMNINIGRSFSISNHEGVDTSTTLGLDGATALGLSIAGVGAISANPTALAAGAAASGVLIANRAVSESYGVSLAKSTSVDIGTYLVAQIAEFDLKVLQYERCLGLRLGKNILNLTLEEGFYSQLSLVDHTKETLFKVRKALGQGLFICEGEVEKKETTIKEKYYYITQHFTAGDMLDIANLLNHVWLLALRGDRDFKAFIDLTQSQKVNDQGEIIPESKAPIYPISRLEHVYSKVVPSFPGMYSVPDSFTVQAPK